MLNMNFEKMVSIDTNGQEWQPSPMQGVWRKPLAREEAERGHATSIVRYEPGSSFKAHDHPGGEEILVLEGTFSDRLGDFPAGTYFRNPVGYRHAPFSDEGCLLLVKLHQIPEDDRQRVQIDTRQSQGWLHIDQGEQLTLHRFQQEQVSLLRLDRGAQLSTDRMRAGAELYLLDGVLLNDRLRLEAGHWARFPRGWEQPLETLCPSLLWLKTGHLPT